MIFAAFDIDILFLLVAAAIAGISRLVSAVREIRKRTREKMAEREEAVGVQFEDERRPSMAEAAPPVVRRPSRLVLGGPGEPAEPGEPAPPPESAVRAAAAVRRAEERLRPPPGARRRRRRRVRPVDIHALVLALGRAGGSRDAVILREVLSPPLALRTPGEAHYEQ